ncbi:MAG: TIGR02757 family protein [Myxococcales bacterium]|nr:TIGR02757 family protein [Myxococcales bacterium]
MNPELGPYLERLIDSTALAQRRQADPVSFVHRFDDPRDQEVAAVVAGTLAYGRVAAFRVVLDQIFALADEEGGPRRWVDAFDPEVHGKPLRPLVYRWNRGVDWVLLIAGLSQLYRGSDSLEELLPSADRSTDDTVEALNILVTSIRDAVVGVADACGVQVGTFAELPRGLRTLLPRPAEGSATKRWWMILRWLVRRPTYGIDLGLWQTRDPAHLVVPLDTHVLRVSRFLGMTGRNDGSLRTALEVTAALRAIDPRDPVRFDFAMAHLGISGQCRGRRHRPICATCPLDPVCTAV